MYCGVRAVSHQTEMAEFEGGGVRSSDEGKPQFELLLTPGMDYEEQLMTKVARRMAEGAALYGRYNYAKMSSDEALERAYGSLLRHAMQHINGERDEEHLAAVVANCIMISKIEHNRRGTNE